MVSQLVDLSTGNTIITTEITIVEVISAFNRRVREATLTQEDYELVRADFDALCGSEYRFVSTALPVLERARDLLEQHPLRAYDAVQLATGLIANDTLLGAGLPALTFLSADTRLLNVAITEGLVTDNPNVYP
ncbi:MAG: type II toxin-antitoxin system VapC family toxin [Herpetosiphonaceae bacterium]|nr:type II toxin-antitoxin system VapC family toxin [Herpetosiphonaceae bacterium]